MEINLKLTKEKILEFCSKYCKNNIHSQCHAIWNGLGFEVICNCVCHVKKMLDEGESLSNIINSTPFQSEEYA
jgi:hypothetical protein